MIKMFQIAELCGQNQQYTTIFTSLFADCLLIMLTLFGNI